MRLSGCITALATPFREDGSIDLPAWRGLLSAQRRAGVDAVVVAGSTGEAASLSDGEYTELLAVALEEVGSHLPVIAGTGLSATGKTIAQTRLAAGIGASAALVVTPPYVRPTALGLVAHYTAVAEQGGLPVVLYNVPPRTGVDMQPETVAALAAHPNVIGLKEARGDEGRWEALYPLRSSTFALLSGDDPTFVRAMRGGADGVVSVASNVVPGTFRRIMSAFAAGEVASAVSLDARLAPLHAFLGCEPNPIPLKALLHRLGCGHGLRLPLTDLSPVHHEMLVAMQSLVLNLEADALAAAA